MRPEVLARLACPRCGGALHAAPGRLGCVACAASWPIRGGVPRFVGAEADPPTREAFAGQWRLRREGHFEPGARLYGHDVDGLVCWVFDEALGGAPAGSWVLDAGCGSGEKAAALARRRPDLQVVAFDLSDGVDTVAPTAPPNLCLLQADVLAPPLRAGAFDRAWSYGVLHHTADPAAGFAAVARALGPDGRLFVHLYPDPEESPGLRTYYTIRDVHFRGRGHTLSPRVRLWACRVYVAGAAPWLWLRQRRDLAHAEATMPFLRIGRDPPWRAWQSGVFIVYDDISPPRQSRHRREEVERWFREAGLGRPETDGVGHWWGGRG